MSRSFVSLALVAALAVVAPAAQQSSRVGRWAEVGREFILHVEATGTVRPYVPAPQLGATYKVAGDRVVLIGPDQSTQELVLQGDTLTIKGGVELTRMPGGAGTSGKLTIPGTWVQKPSETRFAIWTFRSDGQVILEVSLPKMATTFTGDTLALLEKTYTVREANDELILEEGGTTRRFVRRPWGCFGTKFDGDAAECKAGKNSAETRRGPAHAGGRTSRSSSLR